MRTRRSWRPRGSVTEQEAVRRAWERIAPLALYPRPVDLTRVRILSVPWLFRLPWFRRFDGYTIWSTILLRHRSQPLDAELIAHELVHVWQGQHEWVRLWRSYLRPSTFWGDRSGYWENRYELEARSAVARTSASPVSSSGAAISVLCTADHPHLDRRRARS